MAKKNQSKKDEILNLLFLDGIRETNKFYPFEIETLIKNGQIVPSDVKIFKILKEILDDKDIDIHIRFNSFYLILRELRYTGKYKAHADIFYRYQNIFAEFKYMKMLEANAIRFCKIDKMSLLQSIELTEEAIHLIPNSISFKRNYASCVTKYCRYHGIDQMLLNKAKAYFENVLQEKDDFMLYHETYAKLLELEGKYSDAFDITLRAISEEYDFNKKDKYSETLERLYLLKNIQTVSDSLNKEYKELVIKMKKETDTELDKIKDSMEVNKEKVITDIENSKMDMIQTLGLFAAIIAFIVSSIVNVNNANNHGADISKMCFILLETCFICVTVFSVFSILFTRPGAKIVPRQWILLIVGVIGLLGSYLSLI